MKEYCHLKNYELKLITKAPVFIGSGREYNKKEYYFDAKNKKVNIINLPDMFSLLYSRGLIDEYEEYILNRPSDDLYRFFHDCNITDKEIETITDYTAEVSDALVEGKSIVAIKQFMRDSKLRPYIPGSSVKGCLRTAILWKMINADKKTFEEHTKAKMIEQTYLNTLQLNKMKMTNEVNSIMRGISISDSCFIDSNQMILTKKEDVSTAGYKNFVHIIREAISPGTTIHFVLTIDESIRSNVNVEFIRAAVKEYGEYYQNTFANSFLLQQNSEQESYQDCIVLGGGSGYFGKNIIYPLYGKKNAVKKVSEIMQKKYYKHHHEKDITLGISPHMIKHTSYQSKSYHYGVCKVEIS